jgi:glucan endo-1,3-alpha-glucosidase
VAKPTGWDWTTDYLWAVVLATADSTVTLTSGSNTQSFAVKAGLTKLRIPNAVGGVSGSVARNGQTVAALTIDGFQYTNSPALYNYNYIVKASD